MRHTIVMQDGSTETFDDAKEPAWGAALVARARYRTCLDAWPAHARSANVFRVLCGLLDEFATAAAAVEPGERRDRLMAEVAAEITRIKQLRPHVGRELGRA